jgi:anti-anti-sigma factor
MSSAGGNRPVILHGEYDLSRKAELASILSRLSFNEPILIDMTDVSFVDSTFLHELAILQSRCLGGAPVLVGVQPNVRRILRITGLDRHFTLHPAPQAAAS